MRSRTINMSQGKPLKLLTLLAVPLFVDNLLQKAYNLADSIIIAQFVGTGGLVAVGATSSNSFMFYLMSNDITSGGGLARSESTTPTTITNRCLITRRSLTLRYALKRMDHPVMYLGRQVSGIWCSRHEEGLSG